MSPTFRVSLVMNIISRAARRQTGEDGCRHRPLQSQQGAVLHQAKTTRGRQLVLQVGEINVLARGVDDHPQVRAGR